MTGTRVGAVREIWRYPIKSMRGERLDACRVEPRGLEGDRRLAVYDTEGKIGSGKITRRFRPIEGLRTYAAALGERGATIASVRGAGVDASGPALSAALGQHVSLAAEHEMPHHDAAPVHLLSSASLAWISARVGRTLGAFEFRPNILFDTDLSWPAEQGWCGRLLAIGETVRLRITEPTERCIMVGACHDGSHDEHVLRVLARENDACLGVYADVVAAGLLREGDAMLLD